MSIKSYDSTIYLECFYCHSRKYVGSLIDSDDEEIFACEECFNRCVCLLCYQKTEHFLQCVCPLCQNSTNPMIGCEECILECERCEERFGIRCPNNLPLCIKCEDDF